MTPRSLYLATPLQAPDAQSYCLLQAALPFRPRFDNPALSAQAEGDDLAFAEATKQLRRPTPAQRAPASSKRTMRAEGGDGKHAEATEPLRRLTPNQAEATEPPRRLTPAQRAPALSRRTKQKPQSRRGDSRQHKEHQRRAGAPRELMAAMASTPKRK